MANVLSGNPLKIDTLGDVYATPAQQSCRMNIAHIEFVGYSVATDEGILTDNEGREVWRAHGSDDMSPVVSQDIGWVKGLIATSFTLGTGFFLVYLRP